MAGLPRKNSLEEIMQSLEGEVAPPPPPPRRISSYEDIMNEAASENTGASSTQPLPLKSSELIS
jgi:hypothetical protein